MFLELALNCVVYAGRDRHVPRYGSSVESQKQGERIEILNFALLDYVVRHNFGDDFICLKLEGEDSNSRIDYLFCREDEITKRGDLIVLHRTPLLVGESRRSATEETLSRETISQYVEQSCAFEAAFVYTAIRAEDNAWKNRFEADEQNLLALELTQAVSLDNRALVPCFASDVEYLTRLYESGVIDYPVVQAHLKLSSLVSFWKRFKNHVDTYSKRHEKTLEVRAKIVRVYETIELLRRIDAREILQFSSTCKELL